MAKKTFYDDFWGTDGDDKAQLTVSGFMAGRGGNDRLFGRDGNDSIYGGDGKDFLRGGSGNDKIWGDRHDDILHGDLGDDLVKGGFGDDRVYGGSGNDTVSGGSDDDFVYGGSGKDKVYGDHGNDRVGGGADDDQVMGGMGNDKVVGGLGNDELWGCGYHNVGGEVWYVGDWTYKYRGDDVFVFRNREGEGDDIIKDWGDGDNDRIQIIGVTYSELNIYQKGEHTVIKYGVDNSITLENTLASSIDETDFIF